MELSRLKALIDLVSASRISELEVTEAGETVRIVRTMPPAAGKAAAAIIAPVVNGAVAPPVAVPSAPATAATSVDGHTVAATMYGIFHRKPSPTSPPFVEVGQQVAVGQKLYVIEAMKTFNEIQAEVAGTIAAILVENGEEVEAGQPLFRIVPA
jgi:acetyl-CoA carboxylase biotin carboxyl carrier protein